MIFFVQNLGKWVLDWIMPRYCFGCDAEGEWFCAKCIENKIEFKNIQVCPDCRCFSEEGLMCKRCLCKWFLDGLVVCCEKNKILGKLVSEYKYKDIFDLGEILGELYLHDNLKKIYREIDLVIPVPLERKRQWWRGFNQSELIARKISKKIEKNYQNVIIRKKFDKQQVGLSKKERFENVSGVFELNGDVFGKRILLVDDVCTTMATMNECAKVLKLGGAKKIIGVVIARGL